MYVGGFVGATMYTEPWPPFSAHRGARGGNGPVWYGPQWAAMGQEGIVETA